MHDEWIIGEGATSGAWYVYHALPPRFMALVDEDDEDDGVFFTEIEFVDPVPDESMLAKLARQAGEVLDRYDTRRLEGDTIGQRIRSARQNLSWSVADLAAEISVSDQQIYRWERDAEKPSRDRLCDLGDALGVAPGWLLSGD